MEIGKAIAWGLLFLALGGAACFWQLLEYRAKLGWTIFWIGFVPVPVGLLGIGFLAVGIVELFRAFSGHPS